MRRGILTARRIINCDAARHVATRTRARKDDTHEYGDYGDAGGEIFAKTAKTPPLQSALRGGYCDDRRLVVTARYAALAFAIIAPPRYLCPT